MRKHLYILLLTVVMLAIIYLLSTFIVNYNQDKDVEREHQKKMNELIYLQKLENIKTQAELKLDIMKLDSMIIESRKRMGYIVSVTTAK